MKSNTDDNNDMIRELNKVMKKVEEMEKRVELHGFYLRAMFEVMKSELHVEPDAITEKLAAVIRDKGERVKATCSQCDRPLGDKQKCIYCGTERVAATVFDLL